MKADLTRVTFDPLNHFSTVLMQQGRVQLDADWNEQAAILSNLLRRLAVDSFGPHSLHSTAFRIGTIAPMTSPTPVTDDFTISAGSYYVDGIECEVGDTPAPILNWSDSQLQATVACWTVDGTPFAKGQYLQVFDGTIYPPTPFNSGKVVRIASLDYVNMTLTLDADPSPLPATQPQFRRLMTYKSQPDLPQPPAKLASGQVYLDVWERLITFVEDDSVREVALEGPDTAARARVVWQVKVMPNTAAEATQCMTQQQICQTLQPWNRGLLRARTTPSQSSSDPCIVVPDSKYQGPENQLYRVEINTGGSLQLTATELPAPTFKWSRENGSVVFPIAAVSPGSGVTTVTLTNLGRDDRFGLVEGDYVELEDDDSVLGNVAGQLLQVQSIDRTSLSVVLTGSPGSTVGSNPNRHPLLRRWDQKSGDPSQGGLQLGTDNAALIPLPSAGSPDPWLNLEDGVQIQFVTLPGVQFRTSDYWLIPARVATGDVLWPTETGPDAQGKPVTKQLAKPPDGVTHHYAPLAIISVDGTNPPALQSCTQGQG